MCEIYFTTQSAIFHFSNSMAQLNYTTFLNEFILGKTPKTRICTIFSDTLNSLFSRIFAFVRERRIHRESNTALWFLI